MTLPLRGMRAVDLADEKGELCGRILADLGADVVRVEPPEGAVSRTLEPFTPDGETSLYFATRNAGKHGATLDLSDDEALERLHGWLEQADVLIESFGPGGLAARGLDPDALRARHPHLVITSISDFGHTGPYRDYAGTDMVGFALGGMMHRAGRPERPPLVIPGALAYDSAGVAAVYPMLLAFWKRLATGRGQHIDASAFEATAALSDWSMPSYSVIGGHVGTRAGTGPYTLYRCADGHIRMIILVLHHWNTLKQWIGSPPELDDPQLDQFLQRLVRMDEIVPVIEGFFRDKKKVDVALEAQRLGIPATPLLEPGDVLTNEHVVARGTFTKLEVGDGLAAQVASGFVTVDGERAGPRHPAPARGADFTGFSADDADRDALFAGSEAAPAEGHPLEGVRVIDFGVGAVGVEVGRLLAEMGAEVIKIETRQAPDFIRAIMGTFMNPPFASSSRSKQSFGVNLKTEEGRALVRELVRDADVLIENNGTGVMERLGFGPDQIRELNPRIISFSSQMVGSSGPWKDWIGYGPNTHPVVGLQWLWNYPEDADRPAGSTNVHPDHFVGRIGALSVMAGLIERRRSGRGLHTDAAQFESAIGLLADLLARESLDAGSVRPLGNARERGAPWGCYRCEGDDEWCVITVATDEQWQGLRRALGAPDESEWAGNPHYETADGRKANRGAIDVLLEEWTRTLPPREVMARLQAERVPAGVVSHPKHLLEDPQLAARGYHRPVEQPGFGTIVMEGPAFHATDLPQPIMTAAPQLGEHTREVARRLLGLDDAKIEALVAEGILEDPPD